MMERALFAKCLAIALTPIPLTDCDWVWLHVGAIATASLIDSEKWRIDEWETSDNNTNSNIYDNSNSICISISDNISGITMICVNQSVWGAVRARAMDSRLSVPMSSGPQHQRSPSSSSSVTLTCRTCELRTNHAPGSRLRTICPRCGNFYVSDRLEPGSVERNSRVHQRNRSNSRLQSPIMPRRFPSLENHVRLNDYFHEALYESTQIVIFKPCSSIRHWSFVVDDFA